MGRSRRAAVRRVCVRATARAVIVTGVRMGLRPTAVAGPLQKPGSQKFPHGRRQGFERALQGLLQPLEINAAVGPCREREGGGPVQGLYGSVGPFELVSVGRRHEVETGGAALVTVANELFEQQHAGAGFLMGNVVGKDVSGKRRL